MVIDERVYFLKNYKIRLFLVQNTEKRVEFYEEEIDIRIESIKLEIDLCGRKLEDSLIKLVKKRINNRTKAQQIVLDTTDKEGCNIIQRDVEQIEEDKCTPTTCLKNEKIITKSDVGLFKASEYLIDLLFLKFV